jgi:hypothetical protein
LVDVSGLTPLAAADCGLHPRSAMPRAARLGCLALVCASLSACNDQAAPSTRASASQSPSPAESATAAASTPVLAPPVAVRPLRAISFDDPKYCPLWVERLGTDLLLVSDYRIGVVDAQGKISSFAESARAKTDLGNIAHRKPKAIIGRYPAPLAVLTSESGLNGQGAPISDGSWAVRATRSGSWDSIDPEVLFVGPTRGRKLLTLSGNRSPARPEFKIDGALAAIEPTETAALALPRLNAHIAMLSFDSGEVFVVGTNTNDPAPKLLLERFDAGGHATLAALPGLPDLDRMPPSWPSARFGYEKEQLIELRGERPDQVWLVLRDRKTQYVARFDGIEWQSSTLPDERQIVLAAVAPDGRLFTVVGTEETANTSEQALRVFDALGRSVDAPLPALEHAVVLRSLAVSQAGDAFITVMRFEAGRGKAAYLITSQPSLDAEALTRVVTDNVPPTVIHK